MLIIINIFFFKLSLKVNFIPACIVQNEMCYVNKTKCVGFFSSYLTIKIQQAPFPLVRGLIPNCVIVNFP